MTGPFLANRVAHRDDQSEIDLSMPLNSESAAALLELGRRVADSVDLIEKSLDCFVLTSEQRTEAVARLIEEVGRRWPHFIKIMTVSALLPLIQEKAQAYFLSQQVALPDAEDLSETVVLKIAAGLFGGWPRGNLGTWVTVIRKNVLNDHWRQGRRHREHFGQRHGEALLKNRVDPADQREMLSRFIRDLPTLTQAIVEKRREGEDWPEIASDLGITLEEALRAVHGVEWPGGLSGLRKRRRKKRSS